tara:strand:+ start:3591 stop:3791 length:201 start_codon:yes stop_codon:yes gene_type:complete
MVIILLRSKWMSKNSKTSSNKAIAVGTSLGIIIGAAIGSKTSEVGFWVSMGICFGAALGATIGKQN